MNTLPTASLACTENGSDKVYLLAVQPQADGFVVTFQNGRRGSALSGGLKTPAPVDLDAAMRVFEATLKAKVKGGYKPYGDATDNAPVVQLLSAADTTRDSGLRPMLSNEVSARDVQALMLDDGWCVQEKLDGQRRLTRICAEGSVSGFNRDGRVIPLAADLASALTALAVTGETVLDGEAIGNAVHVFDAQRINGQDVRGHSFAQRTAAIAVLLGAPSASSNATLRSVPTAVTTAAKRALFDRIVSERGEGVVFHRLESPYREGRPSAGGDSLKRKFVASLSAIVTGINAGKRSITTAVYAADGSPVALGSCTVPTNHAIPSIGQVVELRYLYAFAASQKLFQPQLDRVRNDIDPSECTVSQLKFKPASE